MKVLKDGKIIEVILNPHIDPWASMPESMPDKWEDEDESIRKDT